MNAKGMYHLHLFKWNDIELRKKAIAIREKVFIEEQNVPREMELDGKDNDCTHIIVLDKANYGIGTARLRFLHPQKVKLERFAVLPENRGEKIGELLVLKALSVLNPTHHIFLHAQEQVIKFYAKYGFEEKGDFFTEAGINHKMMIYNRVC